MQGDVTDYSLRTFNDITAFQYTLWAKDRHMWTMILKYLSKEEAASQLHDHVSNEKKYKEMHGPYYDFFPLIDALQTYIDNYDAWTPSQRAKHWCEKVGGEQCLVPAHVANEYCHPDRSFDPTPQFKESTLPRGLNFNNYVTGAAAVWFPLTSNAGRDGLFGSCVDAPWLARGLARRGYGGVDVWAAGGLVSFPAHGAALSCAGVTALCKVRTAELVELKQQLLNLAPESQKSSSCVIS